MRINIHPSPALWPEIMKRAVRDDAEIEGIVRSIIERVRSGGDAALRQLAQEIDGVSLGGLEVSQEEFALAAEAVPEELKAAISNAAANIRRFHEAQRPGEVRVETAPGVVCWQKSVPIEKIGLYVPGGRAPLFSTVLMLAIPAVVAGCPDIVLCTPPSPGGGVNPAILHAASVCGIRKVLKAGGAQAIAAMALGTESVGRRDKIFGPGNRFVMKAKQILSQGEVAIDMPAGPSEVMVIADESACVPFVAADLLSQAEHGPDSQCILVCMSGSFALAVSAEVERQAALLPRRDSVVKSLEISSINVLESREEAIRFANAYAPEHLIISTEDPEEIASKITAAGSVFLGNYSPESAGDYASGTNHTLPTSGWARSYSGVSLESFMRRMTFQKLSREGLAGLADTIITMAGAEGLDAHAAAVKTRLGL